MNDLQKLQSQPQPSQPKLFSYKWFKGKWVELFRDQAPTMKHLDSNDIAGLIIDNWTESRERDWYIKRRPMVFAFVVLGGFIALVAGFIGQPPRSAVGTWWATIVAAVALIILGWSTFPYFAARRAFVERRRMMAKIRARLALEDMTKDDPIELHALFRYNRQQLDAYQEDSRNQQRAAFRHAQFASLVGFVVLVAGIAISLKQVPGSEKYVVAGLSGLGAALSGYVANTFVKAARRADRQLNLYYAEPHMMGRLIAAERIATTLCKSDEEHAGTAIITQALAWSIPGADGTKDGKASNSDQSSRDKAA
jgi:hypothetical protein